MNNYQIKKFERNMNFYAQECDKMRDSISNLINLISDNKDLHGPHKKLMLELLKDICNNVIVGNTHLNKSIMTMLKSTKDILNKKWSI